MILWPREQFCPHAIRCKLIANKAGRLVVKESGVHGEGLLLYVSVLCWLVRMLWAGRMMNFAEGLIYRSVDTLAHPREHLHVAAEAVF